MRSPSYGFLTAIVLTYAAVVAAGYFIWPGKYDAISAWAVSLTGGVVLWYTWETMQLHHAAHAQREIQLRPFVVIQRAERTFQLQNLRYGPALNVKVSDVVIDAHEQIVVRFPGLISILPVGEIRDIETQSFHGEANMGEFFAAHLDLRYAIMDLQLDVAFQNVEMKSYRVSVRVGSGKVEVLGVSEA